MNFSGEISDEFSSNLDVLIAKDNRTANTSSLVLAFTEDNVYDGFIYSSFPNNLRKSFVGIRKKSSEEVKFSYNYTYIASVTR